jgi:hypothetical protein
MAAIHFENLVFILFVIVAFFFQVLARAATKASKRSSQPKPQSPSSPPPPPRAPANSEEDRIRKFLEALGQPASSQPPAPVVPRPTYQKPIVVSRLPPLKSPLPPLKTRPPELPRKIQLPEQITPVHVPAAPLAPDLTSVVKEAAEAYVTTTQPASKTDQIPIVRLIRSPSGPRDAIILREIFGPPRSLQPLDLVGTV